MILRSFGKRYFLLVLVLLYYISRSLLLLNNGLDDVIIRIKKYTTHLHIIFPMLNIRP